MLRRLIATLGTAVLAAAALAGPQTYASRVQPIRAGIVVLDSSLSSSGYPDTLAPFAFYNFGSNTSVKPIGWNVSNPHAPGRVTTDIAVRYTALGKNPPAVGTEITKRDAPYWEVFLDSVTASDLGDYDILLVAPRYNGSLTPTEREKLRSFVDHGGVLWIDPSGLNMGISGIDPANNYPAAFELRSAAASGTDLFDYTHPLINRPYALTSRDINILNTSLPGSPLQFRGTIDSIRPTDFTLSPVFLSSDVASFGSIRPVTLLNDGSNSFETMGVAQIGDGFVVITSRGAAMKLNRVASPGGPYDYTLNLGYQALQPPALDQDGLTSSKLLVNMISMLSQYRQQAGGSHKSGGSPLTMAAPLLVRSRDTSVTFDAAATYGAVLYKGMVIASVNGASNGYHLVAYDPNPGRDLDGDGNPDDGLQDANPGSGVDVIWESGTLNGPISQPVVAEVPDATTGIPADQVLVIDADGALHAFNPIARTADGRHLDGNQRQEIYPGGAIQPPNSENRVAPTGYITPNAPTVHEGIAYIADAISPNSNAVGRIWMVNLRNGTAVKTTRQWFLGGGGISPFQAQPFIASPTVGYIPILDNSGGSDKVLYAPMALDANGGAPAGIMSIWLGARGEKPSTPRIEGGSLVIDTRASPNGIPIYVNSASASDPMNPKLSITVNGVPMTASDLASRFDGTVSQSAGSLSFGLKAGASLPTDAQVRVDYNFDLGANEFQSVAESIKRGTVQLPDQTTNLRRNIVGPIAMTAKGTLYVAVNGGSGAALFGLREEGRGAFRCVMRYELYPTLKYNAQGRPQDVLLPVVEDHDPVVNFLPGILGQPFTNFSIVGSPAVSNDQVFVTVRASKSGVPATVVMAFRSEPDTPHFTIDSVPEGSVLVQPDMARSTSNNANATLDVPTVIPSANYTWDPDTHVLRIENLMNTSRGIVQQCLSTSQPLYLRAPGGADVPLIPDSQGGASWSPLLWYSVINGYSAQVGPVVAGDSLFVGGTSPLRSILIRGTFDASTTFDALLYGMRAQIDPDDDYLKPTSGRPWLKQLWSLRDSGDLTANPDIKWPQMSNLQSTDDYIVHLNQTRMALSTEVRGLAVGDGTLAALGSGGFYTYTKADVVVADQGRLAMYDAAGDPVWSTTATADTNPSGSAGNVHQLVRPTRAYRLNETEMLVVDSGANRVFKMNMGGVETRTLTGFTLDPNFSPEGYPSNGSLKLSNPQDATTYSNVVYYPEAGGPSLGDGESSTGFEYWDHYLIADSGNHRLVEIIDRYGYDINTGRILGPIKVNGVSQLGVLFWHSPSVVSGKGYSYNSIIRAALPTGQFVYVAGISNALPTPADTGGAAPGPNDLRDTASGNGGIVIFDPLKPNTPVVINSMAVPTIPANILWNNSSNSFVSPAKNGGTKYFSNLNSISATVGVSSSNYVIRIMISDATGVYEGNYTPGAGVSGSALPVTWMLPNEVYRTLLFAGGTPSGSNPSTLRAVYAQRVDDDNVLIVNGYFGKTRGGDPFSGEVIQIDGGPLDLTKANLGLTGGSISLRLASNGATRGLILPAFANRG